MNEQCCGNCCYWKEGMCKYFPPITGSFPKVEAGDWCGQWAPCPLPEMPAEGAPGE